MGTLRKILLGTFSTAIGISFISNITSYIIERNDLRNTKANSLEEGKRIAKHKAESTLQDTSNPLSYALIGGARVAASQYLRNNQKSTSKD